MFTNKYTCIIIIRFLFHCRWFQGFDWDGLQSQTMTPPILPKVCIYIGKRLVPAIRNSHEPYIGVMCHDIF